MSYENYDQTDSRTDLDRVRLRRDQYHYDIRELQTFLDGAKKILDYGAGEGVYTALIDSVFGQAYGFDVYGPFNEFPWRDHSPYDAIVLRGVIEHLREPRGVLTELAAHLVPGGLLALQHVPNANNWDVLGNLIIPGEHLWYFTPIAIGCMVRDMGCSAAGLSFPFYDTPYYGQQGAAFGNVMSFYVRRTVC